MLPPSSPATSCRQFSLSEIKSATNNFSVDLIIGKGSFGYVYKATMGIGPGNTTIVAVKRLNLDSKQGSPEFRTEVNLLPTFRHSHLISLIGYCVDENGNEMILVYEYMANGTLADHIYKNNIKSSFLSWEQRLKICIGVGRGLEYLHTGTGIDQIVIHRDLKSSNILLDADWAPKISDFGLCKTCSPNRPYSPITASVKGTFAYMDPNYCTTHKLSRKTDVYAFGVVLLEVFCGRRALDFEVSKRQTNLVLWAQQCIREGVAHRIIDPGLRGRISDDGLRIFLDITMECLQDRPDKRPTMVEVVAKLVFALASQYTTYSSSVDDESVKILFGHEARSSSSAYSDVDPLRPAVENRSGESDTVKQDHASESSITRYVRRFTWLKSSSENNVLVVPTTLQSDWAKENVSMHNITAATSETPPSLPHDKDDEYEKLFRRMNPPKVAFDNEPCEDATVIKALCACSSSISPMRGSDDERYFPDNHTTIELIGNDRPGLLSEVSAVLTNLECNVVSGEIWTHNTRIAAVMQINDMTTETAIIESERLSNVKKSLLIVLKGGNHNREAKITVSHHRCAHFDRRLHQMMFADGNYEKGLTLNDDQRPKVNVVNCYDKDYSVVTIRCKKTPKVLFDTICSLTYLMYFVSHGSVLMEGPVAYMEFYIRHMDGTPIKSAAERQRVIQCIEATIDSGVSKGLKIEICTTDRIGLLADVTRIIRECVLDITQAEFTTMGANVMFAFCVVDASGCPADPKIIDSLRNAIGRSILRVEDSHANIYQAYEVIFHQVHR